MSIQFKDGQILFNNNQIAMDAACCCGGEPVGCPVMDCGAVCPDYNVIISGFGTTCCLPVVGPGSDNPNGTYVPSSGWRNNGEGVCTYNMNHSSLPHFINIYCSGTQWTMDIYCATGELVARYVVDNLTNCLPTSGWTYDSGTCSPVGTMTISEV